MARFLSLAKTLWLIPAFLLVSASSVLAQNCDWPKSTAGGGTPVPEISPEAVGSAVVVVVAGILILMARRATKPAVNSPS